MEDLFVLFRDRVSSEQIRVVVAEQGYQKIVGGDDVFNVQYNAPKYWEWSPMRRELGGWDVFEEEETSRISSLGVESIFGVSYHVNSLHLLLPLLKHILDRYQGWIAADDAFDVVYDREHVLDFGRG